MATTQSTSTAHQRRHPSRQTEDTEQPPGQVLVTPKPSHDLQVHIEQFDQIEKNFGKNKSFRSQGVVDQALPADQMQVLPRDQRQLATEQKARRPSESAARDRKKSGSHRSGSGTPPVAGGQTPPRQAHQEQRLSRAKGNESGTDDPAKEQYGKVRGDGRSVSYSQRSRSRYTGESRHSYHETFEQT